MTTILAVCTGNVCRSPAIEMMLRSGVGRYPGVGSAVGVGSAGTRALVDRPVAPRMAEALTAAGVEVAPFRSRQLTADVIEGADVVLAAGREHRSALSRLRPDRIDSFFTVAELARYAELLVSRQPTGAVEAADGVGELIQFAIDNRGIVTPRRPEDDDVEDPWGRSRRVHRRVTGLLARHVGTILGAVTGVRG